MPLDLAVLVWGGSGRMCCAVAAWEKRLPAPLHTPSSVVIDPLALNLLPSLAAALAVPCVSLPPAWPLLQWLGHVLPLPVLWVGMALGLAGELSLSSVQHFPYLPFLFSSKCLLLREKVLGKGLTRQQCGVSAEHICRSPEGWSKSKPIRGKKGKLHNVLFSFSWSILQDRNFPLYFLLGRGATQRKGLEDAGKW